jgi:hypothetical protein
MSLLVLWWLGLFLLAVRMTANDARPLPFVFAYVCALSLNHLPGALNYLSSSNGLLAHEETHRGFFATLVGLSAFMGGVALGRFRFSFGPARSRRERLGRVRFSVDADAVAWLFMLVGVVAYFVALPLSRIVPGVAALISPLGSLLLLGIVLVVHAAAVRRDRKRLVLILAVLPLLPLSTLAMGGFLGYGTVWMIFGAAMIFVFWPRRKLFLALAPVLAYAGLSLYPAYSAMRDEFREALWVEGAPLGERLGILGDVVRLIEPYDIANPEHAERIDVRLNQNVMVGMAIEWHEQGFYSLYLGSTVPLWAFIPRALWPDKPPIGGGLDLIADTTGLRYDDETSVGAGHVLELYVNFGWPGIVFGFLVLGFALARLDRTFVDAIRRQDYRRITVLGLVAIPLLATGGNGMEILVAMVAAFVVGTGVGLTLERFIRTHRGRFERRDPAFEADPRMALGLRPDEAFRR